LISNPLVRALTTNEALTNTGNEVIEDVTPNLAWHEPPQDDPNDDAQDEAVNGSA
jgi:hypothetical protein